jgi:cell wall-associated NlpC family hydrolase
MTDADQVTRERAAVVAAAREFIGTPYHHRGALKKVGVDCATLIKLTFEQSGVRPPIDVGKYSRQWHLHSQDPLYEKAVIEHGGREVDEPQPGDIVLYREEGAQVHGHGAIVTGVNPLRILHAFAPAKCVLEGNETEFGRLFGAHKKYFSAW